MKTFSSALGLVGQKLYFPSREATKPAWSLAEVRGRLCQLDEAPGSVALTWLTRLIFQAQAEREPVAWIGEQKKIFFPPDVALHGIDLRALVVVHLPDRERLARATTELLRSGAFGLIIIDVGKGDVPMPLQSRLLGAAQKYDTAVVFITQRAVQSPSLSSLVSLRLVSGWRALREGNFVCHLRACKDKRRAPHWEIEEVFRGPLGLHSCGGAAATTFTQKSPGLAGAAGRGGR